MITTEFTQNSYDNVCRNKNSVEDLLDYFVAVLFGRQKSLDDFVSQGKIVRVWVFHTYMYFNISL